MYSENNTQIIIKNRMLANVPSDIDKSEGSFINDSVAPTSFELETIYKNMDQILDMAFASTAATNGYSAQLELRCAEVGIIKKSGTLSTGTLTFTGTEGMSIPSGTLIQTPNGLQFSTMAIAIISNGIATVAIQSMIEGVSYNVPANVIIQAPIAINGVTSITNSNPTTGGTDIETDLALLERYFLKVQTPATSGNKYHYLNWALEVTGVGSVKVFPLANGPGTVKIVIVDSNKHKASTELLKETFDHIEEVRPIGATVSVVSAVEKLLNVTADIDLVEGYNLGTAQQEFIDSLGAYLQSVAFNTSYISIAKIGNLILSTAGVLDYTDLKVNGLTSNITLADEEIAVLGTVSLGII